MLLGHHGMSSWSNDDKTCYETALEIIDRAAAYIEARDKGATTFGGPKHPPLAEASAGARFIAELLPSLRGRDLGRAAVSSARCRTTRRCCGS